MTVNFRSIELGPYSGSAEHRADGSSLLRSNDPLRDHPHRYTQTLLRWAREKPKASFVAKRGDDGRWMHLTFGDALIKARRIGQALLDAGVSVERPLMILSTNDLEHAMLALAAAHVGVPYVPLSPAYSLLSTDFERARHAVDLLTPSVVFASDAGKYSRVIEAAVPLDVKLVFTRGSLPGRQSTSIAEWLDTEETDDVDAAHDAIGPDTILKFLFTSGSTKLPKAVVNTHGMMTCSMQQYLQCYPFLEKDPPILVDWLPWHHTAGGNNNFGLCLSHGGTLFIDDGKPTPKGMEETLSNLREIAPTVYYTVPKGLESLAHAMKTDAELCDRFFSRLRLIFPAGAALPGPLKKLIDDLAIASCGARIPMTMGLGMTETAPFGISAHLPDWQAGVIGLPAPGVTVKLTPCGDKLEVRYKGPNVTPGYWRQPEMTGEAFDDEGFFCSGDAARFIDDKEPESGLRFDGRIAEDFKLISGTWANVGALRSTVMVAGSPYIHDVVVTGHDRDALGMLVFLMPAALDLASNEDVEWTMLADDPGVIAWLQSLLDRMAEQATGSSHRITRAMIMSEAASMEHGEMTDKGSINQRAVLKRRAHLVESLYADQPSPVVLFARVSP